MSRSRGRYLPFVVVGALFLVLLLVLLTACAPSTQPVGRSGPESPSADRRSDGADGPSGAAAAARARGAELQRADLPSGWTPVPLQERFAEPPGVPSYCGVVVEPEPLHHVALELYEERSTGPFVLQYTFVTDEPVAVSRARQLVTAAADCSEKGFRIEPAAGVPEVGDDTVALDYVSDQGAGARVMVFRSGDALVALVGYGNQGVPRDAVTAIAAAVEARLSS
jgi:hypothetical protein